MLPGVGAHPFELPSVSLTLLLSSAEPRPVLLTLSGRLDFTVWTLDTLYP